MMGTEKQYTGVIFDFNGTLFWDTPLHNEAWRVFLDKHGLFFSDEDMFRLFHGKCNRDIITEMFHGDIPEEEIAEMGLEKERIYQQLCLQSGLALADGAIDFFEMLADRGIVSTIATASGKENVDFFFNTLNLAHWFDYDRVVYNDGTIPGKPAPDIYLKAMSIIGIQPSDAVVFEDAFAGICAAENAHAGRIIVVNSDDNGYDRWNYQIIRSFNEVNHALFQSASHDSLSNV